MVNIGIIIGSTRPGRVGPQVADWVLRLAEQQGTASYQLVDIADYQLPLYAEPVPAAMSQDYHAPEAAAWATKIASLDGFVFVTPEYNRSIPTSLKNAIDYLGPEFFNKAAGIISYGSSGGVTAAGHLRHSLSTLQVATVQAAPALNLFTDFENFSTFTPSPVHEGAVGTLLGQVESWSQALATTRQELAVS